MKIAYCITRMDEIGGAQIHVRDLALEYQRQGHDIFVLCGGDGGHITETLRDAGVSIYYVPSLQREIHPLRDLMAWIKIVRILRKIKPDIVACHSSKAGLLGRLAAKLCAIKTVFTVHGWAFTEGVPAGTAQIYRVVEKIMVYFTDHLITVSQYDKDLALKYRIAPDHQIEVIHNGIPDIADFVPRSQSSLPSVRLLMVARFGQQKDHALLLRALSRCKDLEWTLDLVGGGNVDQCLFDCKAYHLVDRVNILGERKDVGTLLKNTDIFLLISRWEGLPISILEAMRQGLPVIASDVGGVSEAVQDSETGYLIPRGDLESLEVALRRMIVDRNQSFAMGNAGRRRYERDFLFDGMVRKTLQIYMTVC